MRRKQLERLLRGGNGLGIARRFFQLEYLVGGDRRVQRVAGLGAEAFFVGKLEIPHADAVVR